MAPPPRKTGSSAPAGAEDPERATATVARAQNPIAEDPEAGNKTQARAPKPTGSRAAVADDPEKANATVARAKNPVAEDPEVANKTQARAPRPATGARQAPRKPEYKTNEYAPPLEDEGSDYNTGQSYQDDSGEAPAGSLNLEGEGLDPVEPDMVPKTKALPALEEPSGDDDDDDDEDANATRAGPPITLEIVGGPDAGKKKKFKGVRMVIGRTPGVELQLSDQSVSRQHCEIVRGDGGVLLRDLGSGNGTRCNGSKVTEKVLEHGDEIAIGKTRIKFVDEVGAFMKARADKDKAAEGGEKPGEKAAKKPPGEQPAAGGEATEGEAKAEGEGGEGEAAAEGAEEGEAKAGEAEAGGGKEGAAKKPTQPRARPARPVRGASDKQSPLDKFKALPPPVRIGAIAGVALVLLLIVVVVATRPKPPPPVDPNKVAADEKMQLARNAVRDSNYEEAVALIEAAEDLQPGIDKTKLGNKAREELAIQRGLADVRAAVTQNRFDDAKKAMAKVGQSAKGDDEKNKVQAELVAAEVAYKKQKIDEFLAAGELEPAKALLAELPAEHQHEPGRKVADFEVELERLKADEAKTDKASAAASAAARKARREEEISVAFAIVERKFAGADWPRAASECSRVIDNAQGDKEIIARARALQGQIPNFGRNYDEGLKKFKQGQPSVAARPLRAAWQLYLQMGLRANPYGEELKQKLAEASIAQGKEALLRNDIATAAVAYRDAAKLDPSDPRGKQGLDEVVNRADDLYQEAYMIRDREPRDALKKFKIVVDVTPPGSATHEKAKNQIAAMAP